MDNKKIDDLWQGGLWEQPAPVFPTPPPVPVPAGSRGGSRPTLKLKRRKGRHWPKFLGLCALLILLCGVTILCENYITPSGFHWGNSPFGYKDDYDEDVVHDTSPPSIPKAETGTGVTITLHPPKDSPLTLPQVHEKAIPSLVSIESSAGFSYSTGSGVVLTQDGYLITNAHVVAGAKKVTAQLYNNQVFPAKLVGFDAAEDLAVLKIEAEGLTPAEFGDSAALVCGESVSALGDPLGYRATFTNGIVSALNREMEMDDGSTMVLLQTNAAINFGNSGGPLLNQYGQVVGINTIKIVSDDGSAESLGFAIPSTRVKYVADHLIAGTPIGTAAFGFTVSTLRLPEGGLELLLVEPESDAHTKGLQAHDIIQRVNGRPISTTLDLLEIKRSLNPGDLVELTYLRDGQSYTIQIALMDAEELK